LRPSRIRDFDMNDFNKIGQVIALYEENYFTGGFSEWVIKDDLQNRKSMDALSTMGSSGKQTYRLAEKKRFYVEEFSNGWNWINAALNEVRAHQPWDSMLISRCERCRDQAKKLLDIVQNF